MINTHLIGRYARPFFMLILLVGVLVGPGVTLAQDGGGEDGITVHVVQRGETLYSIAQAYGTTVEALQAANGIDNPTLIAVGQRLIIPPGGGQVVPVGLASSVMVQPGDSLRSLALRYGASANEIATLNHITNPEKLVTGQALALAADTGGSQPVGGGVYTVQPGDVATVIAARHRLSLVALLRANRLSHSGELYPGQVLLIPGDGGEVSLRPGPLGRVALNPLPGKQGRTLVIRAQVYQPGALTARFLSRDLRFVPDGQDYVALVGIPRFTPPGIYPLEMVFVGNDNATTTLTRGVSLSPGGYETETIKVPADLDALLDEALLSSEEGFLVQVMTPFTEQRLWTGPFVLPTGGDVASAFGTARTYQSGDVSVAGRFHSGADFAMPVTTPIYAPADGVVAWVGALEVRGNATIINHGWGVYTGYWHQAGINVQAGQQVRQGEKIGSVGDTGLVTGAHLHWELWVAGVQVDPLQWVRTPLP